MFQRSSSAEYQPPGILTWGRFARYSSPVCPDRAWRIGTIADGSCFFHAVLTSTDRTYRSLPQDDREIGCSARTDMVREVRKRLSRGLTREKWKTISGGVAYRAGLQAALRMSESRVHKILVNPDKYEKSRTRRWVFDAMGDDKEAMRAIPAILGRGLFSLASFVRMSEENTDDDQLARKFVSDGVRRLVDKVGQNPNLATSLGHAVVETVAARMGSLFRSALTQAQLESTATAQERVLDPDHWVGTSFIPYFEDQFGVSIRVVDGSTGEVRRRDPGTTAEAGFPNCVVLLTVGNGHYECIGQESPDGEPSNPVITCLFPLASDMETTTRLVEPDTPDAAPGSESDVSDSYEISSSPPVSPRARRN